MRQGWHGDEYLVLFTDREATAASDGYGIADMLPGYQLVGLRGWNDFIVRNSDGGKFTVPTVPCDPKYLQPYQLPAPQSELTPDERFTNRIKWYTTPIAFGGVPNLGENVTWVTHDQHVKLVGLWNKQYRDLTPDGG